MKRNILKYLEVAVRRYNTPNENTAVYLVKVPDCKSQTTLP
ncbi:MAG TPA: hypothetical protein PLO29_01960 [Paludibacter sp.]|nr:hypothetical protein [Paludibacter sp.]